MSPGTRDLTVIRKHLRALDATIKQLQTHRGKSFDTFAENIDEIWSVERGLQLAAQNCLDIASHLSASEGYDVSDYATGIDHLETIGILPREFVMRFRNIAGFRNILVHGYLELDTHHIHHLLNHRLDDFIQFANYIYEYIKVDKT